MMNLRSPRRAAAVVCAAGVAAALIGASSGWAAAAPAVLAAATTTSTTAPTTTTTVAQPKSTTTTSTSTTTRPTTTTTAPAKAGVPKVPLGGPPTTKPAAGATPAPPPDPGPILSAVQSDLTQLSAIGQYGQAVTQVADHQQAVTVAVAGVQSALTGQARAQSAEQAAQSQVGSALERVRELAIAAYVGLGYATPAGTTTNADGTVNTPGGLTGSEATDAQEMLRLVADHDRAQLASTNKGLRQANSAIRAAAKVVAQAQAHLAKAQAELQAAQLVVAQVTKAAVTPAGVTPAATTSSGGGSGGGLSALGATSTTALASAATTSPTASSPTILGPSELTGKEMAAWFASTSKKANTTVPMAQLAADYEKAGQATGVRADIAFAQSVIETGFFSFPSFGQLTAKDNNFAGIGACDTCSHGWSFKDAATGVSAQLELLEAFASIKKVATPLIGNIGVGGCCPTWMALSGTWASNLEYGIEIMTVYHQMLTWVIPQRLIAAGLLAAPPAAAKGPTLAQLPGTQLPGAKAAKPAKP
jgi:hypothetical protein